MEELDHLKTTSPTVYSSIHHNKTGYDLFIYLVQMLIHFISDYDGFATLIKIRR